MSDPVRDHYASARRAITAAAIAGDGQALGNHDFVGWYQTRPETEVETIVDGYDRQGKPWLLADDYGALADRIDRVLYASIN